MMKAETGVMYFEDRGGAHKPRNTDRLLGAGKGEETDFSLSVLKKN